MSQRMRRTWRMHMRNEEQGWMSKKGGGIDLARRVPDTQEPGSGRGAGEGQGRVLRHLRGKEEQESIITWWRSLSTEAWMTSWGDVGTRRRSRSRRARSIAHTPAYCPLPSWKRKLKDSKQLNIAYILVNTNPWNFTKKVWPFDTFPFFLSEPSPKRNVEYGELTSVSLRLPK